MAEGLKKLHAKVMTGSIKCEKKTYMIYDGLRPRMFPRGWHSTIWERDDERQIWKPFHLDMVRS